MLLLLFLLFSREFVLHALSYSWCKCLEYSFCWSKKKEKRNNSRFVDDSSGTRCVTPFLYQAYGFYKSDLGFDSSLWSFTLYDFSSRLGWHFHSNPDYATSYVELSILNGTSEEIECIICSYLSNYSFSCQCCCSSTLSGWYQQTCIKNGGLCILSLSMKQQCLYYF